MREFETARETSHSTEVLPPWGCDPGEAPSKATGVGFQLLTNLQTHVQKLYVLSSRGQERALLLKDSPQGGRQHQESPSCPDPGVGQLWAEKGEVVSPPR